MITLELRFPGLRYHATPWNHHVNEGLVEWPPSPTRIARALLATWHLKARDEISEHTIRWLCEALASEPPVYGLPDNVTPAHTRHYMPVRTGNTTKVFDAFLRIDPSSVLAVSWRALELTDEQLQALSLLADRLSYLGRAESWVEARVTTSPIMQPNASPAAAKEETGGEIVPVLCTVSPADYAGWREAEIDRQLSLRLEEQRRKDAAKGKAIEKTKLLKKDRARVEASVPPDLFSALHVDTNVLRKQGWSAPPGTRWVSYNRPHLRQPSPRIALAERSPPTAVRFAVSGSVLPRLTDALRLGEAVRAILAGSRLSVFHGKDDLGQRLEGHEHAMFMPESNDTQGRITHLNLFARAGFDEDAQREIDRLAAREIRLSKDSAHPLKLTLIGIGEPAELGDTGAPLFQRSRRWVSVTPFIPTRHAKRRRNGSPRLDAERQWIGSPVHDLLRLFELAGLPQVTHLEATTGARLGDRLVRWLDFYRWRNHGRGARGDSRGFGFLVEFAEPVRGPIAVGYGAHFGLGIFVPEVA